MLIQCYNMIEPLEKDDSKKDWWNLTFQEKLFEVHRAVLFPEEIDKNKRDFLTMIIQRLIDKVDGKSNDEIDKLFE